jgi:hypothetical protein
VTRRAPLSLALSLLRSRLHPLDTG